MSVLARWTIKPRLMGVPGVANVAIFGQRERQLQVRVDPKQLEQEDVSLDQIVETTGNSLWASPLSFLDAAVPGTGGFIDTPNQRLTVMHKSPITTADQLAEVVIAGTNKRLKDVADVLEDHQPLIGDALVNDAPALMLVVEKFPWANTSEVTHGVENALEALAPAVTGVKMDASLFRPATYIETALGNIRAKLLISGVLVAATLFVLLGNWRSGVVGIVAVATSLVTAGLVLYVLGVQVNMLIVTGLLLGVVVGHRRCSRGRTQHRAASASAPRSRYCRECLVGDSRSHGRDARRTVVRHRDRALGVGPGLLHGGGFGRLPATGRLCLRLGRDCQLAGGTDCHARHFALVVQPRRVGAEESAIAGSLRRSYEQVVSRI